MSKIERTTRIVALRALGSTISEIVVETGASKSNVRSVLENHQHCITDRTPPTGLGVRNAWHIEQSLGFWPDPSKVDEIERRKLDFLREPGTELRQWREIAKWIESCRSAVESSR